MIVARPSRIYNILSWAANIRCWSEERKTYEDPSPSTLSANTIHFRDRGCKEASEGAGEGGGRKEYGGADAKFGALVPAGEVVVYTGEEAGFSDTEEPALRMWLVAEGSRRWMIGATYSGHEA